MTSTPCALVGPEWPPFEPPGGLTAVAARLHDLRGGAALSLEPLNASYAGAPVRPAVRVTFVGEAGGRWIGFVAGPDLTLDALRQALRDTAPSTSGAFS